MNYLGHHEVAKRYDATRSVDFRTGSFISDFARMAGVRRIIHGIKNPEVQAGLRLHQLTNKPAFDSQPQMIDLEAAMKRELSNVLPLRTAHQAARVAKDLLFDGYVMQLPDSQESFYETIEAVADGDVDLGPSGNPLRQVAERVLETGIPSYHHPSVVAERTAVVLSKTRTPIPTANVLDVERMLMGFQKDVQTLGAITLDQTVTWLQDNFQTSPAQAAIS